MLSADSEVFYLRKPGEG